MVGLPSALECLDSQPKEGEGTIGLTVPKAHHAPLAPRLVGVVAVPVVADVHDGGGRDLAEGPRITVGPELDAGDEHASTPQSSARSDPRAPGITEGSCELPQGVEGDVVARGEQDLEHGLACASKQYEFPGRPLIRTARDQAVRTALDDDPGEGDLRPDRDPLPLAAAGRSTSPGNEASRASRRSVA